MKIRILILLINLFRFLIPRIKGSTLIVPSSWEGSLGDEATLTSITQSLKKRKNEYIAVIGWGKKKAWIHLDDIDKRHTFSKIWGIPWSLNFKLVLVMNRYERLFISGADILDGVYSKSKSLFMLSLANLGYHAKMRVTITGFSISQQADLDCINAITKLQDKVKVCIRDPVSERRLKKHSKNKIYLVADPAFLLPSKRDSKITNTILKWVEVQRAASSLILAININKHVLYQNFELQLQSFVDELISFDNNYSDSISYIFIPHDYREDIDDLGVCNKVYLGFPEEMKNRTYVLSEKVTASEIKGIVSFCDVTLSGRMHMVIASLGVLTPAAGISYLDKFEGLYEHFNLDGLAFDPSDLKYRGKLVQFLTQCFNQRHKHKQIIEKNLDHVIKLAEINIE